MLHLESKYFCVLIIFPFRALTKCEKKISSPIERNTHPATVIRRDVRPSWPVGGFRRRPKSAVAAGRALAPGSRRRARGGHPPSAGRRHGGDIDTAARIGSSMLSAYGRAPPPLQPLTQRRNGTIIIGCGGERSRRARTHSKWHDSGKRKRHYSVKLPAQHQRPAGHGSRALAPSTSTRAGRVVVVETLARGVVETAYVCRRSARARVCE